MSNISTTGYKGVYIDKRSTKHPYEARLFLKYKGKYIRYYIGNYKTPELAHIARIKYIDSLK